MTTATKKYLKTFFDEKALPRVDWELTSEDGTTTHLISNEVVIEHIIMSTGEDEASQIADIIRKIDFHNGDVNHFLEHLAHALINQQR